MMFPVTKDPPSFAILEWLIMLVLLAFAVCCSLKNIKQANQASAIRPTVQSSAEWA
jgi:hypothetical protein